ncbi:MAG: hypothetical protein U0174_07935 [Polyangiaceae bacterium]
MNLASRLLAFCPLAFVFIGACSSSEGSSSGTTSGSSGQQIAEDASATPSCTGQTNVSDGKTTDDTIAAGASVLICYYPQPTEGYCRKITSASEISNYVGSKDKGAIGCKDAVILAGPECPVKNAVGKCDANSIDAQRVYYKCSKFPDAKAHCAQIQGSFTAL